MNSGWLGVINARGVFISASAIFQTADSSISPGRLSPGRRNYTIALDFVSSVGSAAFSVWGGSFMPPQEFHKVFFERVW